MTQNDEPPAPDELSSANDAMTDEPRDLERDVRRRVEERMARFREHLSSRREFLADSAKVGGGALALSAVGSGVAAAQDDGHDDDASSGQQDQPEGFSAEVVAPHATFPDDVAAAFGVSTDGEDHEIGFVRDASTVVVAKVTVEPGGTSGWHTHPGPVIVSVVEGEIDIMFEDDCVTHTYAAGEALVDTGGHAEIATNTSDSEQAVAYAIFLGVPDGEPPTSWVEPRDC